MPRLTIDAKEADVQDGLNLIQAAALIGIEIPHFCYHPALSIVAQCRQCLVEIEGVPKVMPACSTFVRDGLVVKTNTTKAIKAREAVVEFTLINHPLDCPICDKGGECPLQLTAFKHGPGYSRFDGPEEKKVRKKYFLSEKILYDPNRCIMCTRCVRFTDEVTQTGELGYDGRGFRKKIVVFPGKNLDNELSGNVIDLCPVGALLGKDTLHEERVWYWKYTDTICPLCSNGCNITVGIYPRKGRVARVRPRVNHEVNDYWICDRGRYEFKIVQDENRLREPFIREGEGFRIATWDETLDLLAAEIIRTKNDPSTSIYEGKIKALYVVGEDLFSVVKGGERGKLREVLSKLSFLAVQDFKLTETAKLAHVIIPGANPYEKDGTFTNDMGRIQSIKKTIPPQGSAKPDWEILCLLGKRFSQEGFNYVSPSQIMLEIADRIPAYNGMNYDKF